MRTPAANRAEGPAGFLTTRWPVVLGTGAADTDTRRGSLEEPRRLYGRPVLAYLRRRHGLAADDQEIQALLELMGST